MLITRRCSQPHGKGWTQHKSKINPPLVKPLRFNNPANRGNPSSGQFSLLEKKVGIDRIGQDKRISNIISLANQ